jgi:large subunit ribosomal protein L14e
LSSINVSQVFTRFVEVGRVCIVNYGPDAGKLCTIVDIVDQNKCLVDGPRKLTGVGRQVIPFKRLALTDLVCKIERSARSQEITDAFKVSEIVFVLSKQFLFLFDPLRIIMVITEFYNNVLFAFSLFQTADIINKWESTSWAKKISAKAKRATLNDFDRFKVMVARKQKTQLVAAKVAQLKK